jgi:hypothetical protein
MSQAGHNRLEALAADIRQAHHESRTAAEQAAERAIAAGHALIEAKALVQHGEWASWLEWNVGFSERTARRYMQLARSGLKTATVAEMGIRAAAESLAKATGQPSWAAGLDEADVARLNEIEGEIKSTLARVRDDTIESGGRLAHLQSTTPPDEWRAFLAHEFPDTDEGPGIDEQHAQALIDAATDPASLSDDRLLELCLSQTVAWFEKQEAAREADLKAASS